tara:strand:+ start:16070 stop:17875 length:1806 start_codon:yes stop_codon:yes gene_type:complete
MFKINKLLIEKENSFVILIDFISLSLIYAVIKLSIFPEKIDTLFFDTLLYGTVCTITLKYFGNYNIYWSYFKFRNINSLLLPVIISVSFMLIYNKLILNIEFILLLTSLSLNILVLLRILYVNWKKVFKSSENKENTIILGAGNAGIQISDQLLSLPSLKFIPVGFLDDSSDLHGRTINGLKVFGNISLLPEIKNKYEISKVILAIPSASRSQILKISKYSRIANVTLKTLPSLSQILNGKVNPYQIKDIDPSDLLGRDAISLDLQPVREIISNEIILVTGAGGSIGSELSFQISKLSPKTVILFEQTELFLYQIEMKLKSLFPTISFVSIIGNIQNCNELETIIKKYKPSVIYHAAAYKHVPLMESNPYEALKTNLFGTYNVAFLAAKHKVPRFVFISTDKAVNPTNVMGASKRAAEIACQIISEDNKATKFMVVRFGNVLGSSGSVIPLFKKQIKEGGPVTITHKDVTRYFMSIPEASQLVMYASTIGKGGDLFLLKMGNPVKILDLAKDMIRLNGLEPDKDISINFTGLRKGEKMHEELVSKKENILETIHPKIYVLKRLKSDKNIRNNIEKLLKLSDNKNNKVKEHLGKLLPGYHFK